MTVLTLRSLTKEGTQSQVMVVSLQNTGVQHRSAPGVPTVSPLNSPDCVLSDVMRRLSPDVTKYHHNNHYQVTGHVTSANILCPSYTQVISLLGLSSSHIIYVFSDYHVSSSSTSQLHKTKIHRSISKYIGLRINQADSLCCCIIAISRHLEISLKDQC